MEPFADIVCNLKVNIHCDTCKLSLMEVIRSIRGVYSVSIDVRGGQEGIAKVAGEVDPNMLLRAISRSGGHAELLNIRIRHPRLRNRYYDDGHSHNYGSLGYRRSGSLPDSAYYEVDQDLYHSRRWPMVDYPYSYSDNYEFCPLPRAIHVPSYPPQYDNYDDHEPISFCSIM